MAADRAARERLAHRVRAAAILDVEGPDRESFLQGQLTQDVQGLRPGEGRETAALTAKGKLLFVARLSGLPDRLRLVLPPVCREAALAHLRRFAAFQKVTVEDRTDAWSRLGLYGPAAAALPAPTGGGAHAIGGGGEFAAEWLVPSERLAEARDRLDRAGSFEIDAESAEALRIEAGRPRFGMDIDATNLPDEAGLDAAISAVKGCFVGQEIVARRRTYGRVNRRLVGFRFPEEPAAPGTLLRRPGADPQRAEPTEAGRVTSLARSPRFGWIGLGFAFHDQAPGSHLSGGDPPREAVVSALPFA